MHYRTTYLRRDEFAAAERAETGREAWPRVARNGVSARCPFAELRPGDVIETLLYDYYVVSYPRVPTPGSDLGVVVTTTRRETALR